jgi:plastocyanin
LKKLLLLIISGVLLAGCYHTPKVTVPVEQSVPAAEEKTPAKTQVTEKNTVVYDDSGFAPNALTVKVGTTVIWKNNGSKMMLVASAVHPTHLELPGFYQPEASGKGTIYSYVFTKAGTWKYHNHVSPGDTGTVVTEE